MNVQRGDVVIVDVPFTDVAGSKTRPAVVVQNDLDNHRIRKTVVATITRNLKRRGDPSHLLIGPGTAEGASAGISAPSLASCNNLFTVEKRMILQIVGHLSDPLKQKLNDCLKAALEIVWRATGLARHRRNAVGVLAGATE